MAEIDLIKISELPATSTIGDADELAVVQGGATKKVPYSVLKAGAEVTPDTTLSEAGVPADAAAVGAALALKANQAAVTQALAAKADKTEVTDISGDIAELASVVETKADQTALNQKADKTTTDALRQDLTTLNGIVSQKADKTELNTQIGNVTAELATKANTADVNNLLAAKANVASPVFTGRPQAPTAPKGTATLQLATTAFVQDAIDDKQDTLTFDAAPTQGSTNPVTSGGVYTALEDAKDDAETAIGEVREESEEATAEAREIALKAFATPTASGQLLTLTDGADGIPAKTLTLNLSPHQSGSGDPSPENVRGISGYTAVKVTRAGKNLLNDTLVNTSLYEKAEDGSAINTSASFGWTYANSAFRQTLPKGDYTFVCIVKTATGTAANVQCYTSDNRRVAAVNNSGAQPGAVLSNVFSLTETTDIGICFKNYGGYCWFMICSRSESDISAYEPYNGEEYDIAIPSEVGTVYGGTLTINDDGSGTLVVDTGYLKVTAASDFAEVGSFAEGTNGNRCGFRVKGNPFERGAECHCNIAKTDASVNSGTASNWIPDTCYLYNSNSTGWGGSSYFRYIFPTTVTSGAEALQYLIDNGCEFTYKLHDPLTYTLTASQVTTLLGDNTVWMDADGSIDLVYRADTEKYVERRIAEVQALVLENNG